MAQESQESDEGRVTGWKAVFSLLSDGKSVEIPCEDEEELERRAEHAAKRAARRGIAVEITRGERLLRIEPRDGGSAATADGEAEKKRLSREERRARRAQRSDDAEADESDL